MHHGPTLLSKINSLLTKVDIMVEAKHKELAIEGFMK